MYESRFEGNKGIFQLKTNLLLLGDSPYDRLLPERHILHLSFTLRR